MQFIVPIGLQKYSKYGPVQATEKYLSYGPISGYPYYVSDETTYTPNTAQTRLKKVALIRPRSGIPRTFVTWVVLGVPL